MTLILVTENDMAAPIQARHGYGISFAPKLKEISESSLWSRLAYAGIGAVGVFVIGAATSGVGWIALGAIGIETFLAGSAYSTIKAALYGERVVSSIYLDTLPSAQEHCFAGDLASIIEE